jgi:hypothetical protein
MKRLFNREPSRALVPIDDVIAALPFVVRRELDNLRNAIEEAVR